MGISLIECRCRHALQLIFGVALLLLTSTSFALAQQEASVSSVHVVVNDEAGVPVSGAKVELHSREVTIAAASTNEHGEVQLPDVAPGVYELIVSMEGFETLQQGGVAVRTRKPTSVQCKLIQKISVQESVDVTAEAAPPVEKGASSTTEIQRTDVKNLPTQPATVADALPLVPGITRSPDGGLSISGSAEHHSAMVVNSVDVTDPATGQFGVTVPVDSVEALSVFKSPYLAEFGRFTAGVVSVETRRGGDKWVFELNDPLPEFRIRSLHLQGLRYATPRFSMSGPLVDQQLYLSEGLELDVEKRPIQSLPFPYNETNKNEINSFTQLDYLISPTNTLTGTFHATNLGLQYVNLGFFTPRPVTPNLDSRSYTGTAIDRLFVGSNLVESTFAVQSYDGDVSGQGSAEMNLTPMGETGNYYSAQQRHDSRIEWREALSLAPVSSLGMHNLKFGMTLTHTANRGQFFARPVNVYDSAGDLLKRIEFVGGKPFDRSDLEIAFYGQDHWTMSPVLALDLGTRFERQSTTGSFRFAPRAGFAWAPFGDQTLVHGGIGIFYDRVPLNVYALDSYPEEVITTYSPNGEVLDGPHRYVNLIARAPESESPFYDQGFKPGNFVPHSLSWNVEIERPLTQYLRLRANYMQSSSNGIVAYSHQVVAGQDALVLSGNGAANSRQLELTARLSWDDKNQIFFSYVHSTANGQLNDFNNYMGNFPFPIVRPDLYATLPADIPNRFLAWGEVRLPKRMLIDPMVEYRNGFPYSNVNAYQNYVGVPNSNRFPNFFSLDARVAKDVPVNKKYTFRFSATGYNLTKHFNPTEVRANTDDPRFGLFFGNLKRRYRLDFDVLW